MKTIILMLVFSFTTLIIIAQTPQSLKYQAVVRDNTSAILSNQPVSFRLNIRTGSPIGTIVYQETHSTITNQLGLANMNIGEGSPTIGTFSLIDWSAGSKYLETELDPLGGSSYVSLGTSQMLSVPYALYSENTANVDDADADPNNELQTISKVGNTVSLSNGGGSFVDDIDDADADPSNELNSNLILSNNNLQITDAGNTLSVSLASLIDDNDWIISGNNIFPAVSGNVGINNTNPLFELDVLGTLYANTPVGSTEPCALFDGKTYFLNKVGIGTTNPGFDLDVLGTLHADVPVGSTEPCALFDGRTYFFDKVGIGTTNPGFDLDVSGTFHADVPVGSTEPCALFAGKTYFLNKVGIGTTNPGFDLDVIGTFHADVPVGSTEPCALFDGETYFLNKVGIGTTNPFYDLEVNGNVAANTFFGDGSNLTGIPGDNLGNHIAGQNIVLSGNWLSGDGGNEGIFVASNGNVGIGTNSVPSRMYVKSTGDGFLGVERNIDNHGGISFYETGTSEPKWIFPYFRGWQSDNLIVREEITNLDVMTFEFGTGKIGIMNPNPDANLDITGDLKVSGAYRGNIGPNNGAPFPRPAFDSGWFTITAVNFATTLTHNIGGNVDNYIVDLQFKGIPPTSPAYPNPVIHNYGYGGDYSSGGWSGVYWADLTTTTIGIVREQNNSTANQVRVRIWVYN